MTDQKRYKANELHSQIEKVKKEIAKWNDPELKPQDNRFPVYIRRCFIEQTESREQELTRADLDFSFVDISLLRLITLSRLRDALLTLEKEYAAI